MNRKRAFTIIQVGNLSDFPSRAYDISLVFAVAVNIFIAIFDTFPQADPSEGIIWVIECVTVIFFAADYVLRVWTADYLYEDLSPARARLKFIFSADACRSMDSSCIPLFPLSPHQVLYHVLFLPPQLSLGLWKPVP